MVVKYGACQLWAFHFPIGILGQVWYLIVSIPDLCTLTHIMISSDRLLTWEKVPLYIYVLHADFGTTPNTNNYQVKKW